MLLEEIFPSTFKNYSLLLEDLGNLNKINKKFLKVLKTKFKSVPDKEATKKATEKGETYPERHKVKATLPDIVGPDSPLKIERIPTIGPALKALDENKGIALIMLDKNGNQIAMAVKIRAEGYKKGGGTAQAAYTIAIDANFFKDILANIDKNIYSGFLTLIDKDGLYTSSGVDYNATGRFLNAIIKEAKAKNYFDKHPEFMLILIDEKRLKTRGERQIRKSGLLQFMSPKELQQHKTNLVHDLRKRLDRYKSSKSIKIDTPEEMMKIILEKGYLDKIKFGEFDYDLSDDRISLRSLKGKDSWGNDGSYIEYRINTSTQPYKKHAQEKKDAQKELVAAAKEAGNEFDYDAWSDMWKIPAKLKVILGFQGGMIVPTSIQIEKETIFW